MIDLFNVVEICHCQDCPDDGKRYIKISKAVGNVVRTVDAGDMKQEILIYCGDEFGRYWAVSSRGSGQKLLRLGKLAVRFGLNTFSYYNVYHDMALPANMVVATAATGRGGLVIIK